mgnify:CR=1 FL=1
MKKTKEVAEAERLQAEKRAELEEAKARVKQLEIEYGLTYAALSKAQQDADAPLPKCKMVSVSRGGHRALGVCWRSSEENANRVACCPLLRPAGRSHLQVQEEPVHGQLL